jgi:hypothetical protein
MAAIIPEAAIASDELIPWLVARTRKQSLAGFEGFPARRIVASLTNPALPGLPVHRANPTCSRAISTARDPDQLVI